MRFGRPGLRLTGVLASGAEPGVASCEAPTAMAPPEGSWEVPGDRDIDAACPAAKYSP